MREHEVPSRHLAPPLPANPNSLPSLLRSARLRAGLSQAALASRAGLSASTIKNLERGRPASGASLRALLAVPELDLPEDLRRGPAPDAPAAADLNAWLAPGFSPLHFFRQMLGVLRGRGGLVDQSFLYFDLQGAADWATIASQQQYDEAHRVVPLDRAARALARLLGPAGPGPLGADVIALGPGDGRLETRLLCHLAALLPCPALCFYLLDISQPLLAEAYRHASAALGRHPGITPIAILGDFHCLAQYHQLSYDLPAAPRRKIVTLLGGTLGNLESECRFLQGSLRGFPPGTLLLLDYPVCFAPADDPAAVRARDPWLAGSPAPPVPEAPPGPPAPGLPPAPPPAAAPTASTPAAPPAVAWREPVLQFWTGPLRRYVPGFLSARVRLELSLPPVCGSVPGSYAVEALADVAVRGEPPRSFSLFRLRRYDPLPLARTLRDLGWDAIDGWPYGGDVGYPRALSLFARRAA